MVTRTKNDISIFSSFTCDFHGNAMIPFNLLNTSLNIIVSMHDTRYLIPKKGKTRISCTYIISADSVLKCEIGFSHVFNVHLHLHVYL